jgi:hypothetical protein
MKTIDKGFDEFCSEYEKEAREKDPKRSFRKYRPSHLWPILFQEFRDGRYVTIAQTTPPEPRSNRWF